jgi:hypothetical protein
MSQDVIISKVEKDNWGKTIGLVVNGTTITVDEFVNKYGDMRKEVMDNRYDFRFEDKWDKKVVKPTFHQKDDKAADFSL